MTKALKIQRDIISLESFSVISPTKSLREYFPAMVKTMCDFLSRYKPKNEELKLSINTKDFLKRLEDINYLDLKDIAVIAPEGLSVNSDLVGYTKVLRETSVRLSTIENSLLRPYNDYLAKLISVDGHKFDTSNYFKLWKEFEQSTSVDLANVSKYNKGKESKTTTFGDLVSRNSDWSVVIDNLAEANKEMSKVVFSRYEELNKSIASHLDIIVSKIKANELDGVSKEVTRNLSEGTYAVAKVIEFTTLVMYYLMTLNTMMLNVETTLHKVTADKTTA